MRAKSTNFLRVRNFYESATRYPEIIWSRLRNPRTARLGARSRCNQPRGYGTDPLPPLRRLTEHARRTRPATSSLAVSRLGARWWVGAARRPLGTPSRLSPVARIRVSDLNHMRVPNGQKCATDENRGKNQKRAHKNPCKTRVSLERLPVVAQVRFGKVT
jgi:hypothetical protein